MKLKFLTSEQHFTPSMYELKSACVVVSKNRTGVVVALAEFVTVENRALSISTEDNCPIALFCVEKQSRATCSTNTRENPRQSRAFPVLRISYFIDWVVIGKSDWLRCLWSDESHFECTTLSWNCVVYQINTDKVWGNFNSLLEVLINLSCSPF